MTQQIDNTVFSANPAENYARFFVPSIGKPMADDLIAAAGLQPGQRVLDVACGTGVVARLAAERVGASGAVTGVDLNPGMLAAARAQQHAGAAIEWLEAGAESLPLPDATFDVALCQMGLQFFTGKLAALREMRRVLKPGGKAIVSVPGPKPALFAILAEALARRVGPEPASFVDLVFSMHDANELRDLLQGAGFGTVDVQAAPKSLRLPLPADFLWQYLYSTPLAQPLAQAGEAARAALERDVCAEWRRFVEDGALRLQVGMTTATAQK